MRSRPGDAESVLVGVKSALGVSWSLRYALSDNLRLLPLAEGVETEEQRDRIVALGYDRAQGFLWSKPLPEEEATESMLAATAGRR